MAIEFLNIYDIMDLLKDLACLKYIKGPWRAIKYVSMGISVLLICIPLDISKDLLQPERGNDNQNEANQTERPEEAMEESCMRIFKLITTIIFMNISFTVMRVRVMVEYETIDNGFIMSVKNCILLVLHSIYVVRHCSVMHTLRRRATTVNIVRPINVQAWNVNY